jgi:hypothetical protein
MNTIIVNGKKYQVQGTNVSVRNNRIYVDGKDITDGAEPFAGIVEIRWEGALAALQSDAAVNVDGDVKGDVKAEGSVNCGHVGGDVKAEGSVNCGRVTGKVKAGGSVNCG